MRNSFRTLLVIGDTPHEIAAKYSADRKTETHKKFELNEAPKLHKNYLKELEVTIKVLEDMPGKENYLEAYRDLYDEYSEMDDFEFFQAISEDYNHNEDGDAVTDENPDAHYQFEKCYDERIRKDQNFEAPFSDPFILKDGSKVYSAKVGEIDWNKVHMLKAPIYEAVWEICVEGREPETDDERTAKEVMSNRDAYFRMFRNKDEYVLHSSAFWTYAVATKDEYIECVGRDIDWTNNFYDRFIKPLPPDETVTLFEIKLLD